MKLLSVGDLIPEGSFKLHSRFERVINFISDENLISVVAEDIGEGPFNIVLKTKCLDGITSLKKLGFDIYLNGEKFTIDNSQIYNSKITFDKANLQLSKNWPSFSRLLAEKSHPKSLGFLLDESRAENFEGTFEKAYVSHMLKAASLVRTGDMSAGIKMMKGCGFGLTPSGDDFILGLLTGLKLKGQVYNKDINTQDLYEVAKGTSPFVNTFLNASRRGSYIKKVKKLLNSILYARSIDVKESFMELLKMGRTSGCDFGVGFHFALNGDVV